MTQQRPEALTCFWLGMDHPEFAKLYWQILCALPVGYSVIDAGAHIGYYALMAAHRLRQVGAGLVFAFEPHPINFADLQRNQQLNNMSNLIQKAVADQTTQMRLFSGPVSGTHSLRQFPYHNDSYEVECIALDDFIIDLITIFGQVKIGLIKLDIEGAELLALRGAQGLIERDKPYILYEENEESTKYFGHNIKDIRSFLESLNYKIYPIIGKMVNDAVAIPKDII